MFGVLINLPSRKRVKKKLQQEARTLAKRGRDRAEELREALPEAGHLVADLREQAQPALEAARDQASRVRKRRRRSRRGPLLVIGLIALGAVVAYLLFARRDMEPAYLASSPDEPDTAPAGDPDPGGIQQSETASDGQAADTQSSQTPTASGAGTRSAEPATAVGSSPAPRTAGFAAGSATGMGSGSMQPRAAAWDLPSPGGTGTRL